MKYTFGLLFCTILSQLSFSQEIEMINDWNQATQLAKNQDKQILVILTGSDWCTPCKKMDKRVISNSKFQEFAKEELVLFLIDITKSVVVDRENQLNKEYEIFQKKYQTNSLPSLILTDYIGTKIKIIEGKKYDLENVMNQLKSD